MYSLISHIICLILVGYSLINGYTNSEIGYATLSLLFYIQYRFDKIEKEIKVNDNTKSN